MQFQLLPHIPRVAPRFPVEQLASVNGKTIWVEIEWPIIVKWLGARAADPEAVRDFIRMHRIEIEHAIKAMFSRRGFRCPVR